MHINKELFRNYCAVIVSLFILQSCSEQRQISTKVKKQFHQSQIMDQYQVGFALYDIQSEKMLFSKDLHKYFTPASNTKLYTFYGSRKMLPEFLPALRYIEREDSLIFWGTGDPSFLQSVLKGKQAYDFLKSSTKQLFYAPGRYSGNFYGAGWQWDDYNDYYQAEINELPIMDNLAHVDINDSGTPVIYPQAFNAKLRLDDKGKRSFKVVREVDSNVFMYPSTKPPKEYTQQIPYKLSIETTLKILSDTLRRQVGLVKMNLPNTARVLYGLPRDTVIKEMLLPSDNFIAEQLILLCADQLGSGLSTSKAIEHIEKKYLQSLPDKPVWVDGSGLSRYNLFTPADMIAVLGLLYKDYNSSEQLFAMLPAGGKSGTLKNAYPKTETPFVFGKTGTVSNVHNQSGYIVTKKGRVFSYSFMNNNFVLPTASVRKEMARIVIFIHENF